MSREERLARRRRVLQLGAVTLILAMAGAWGFVVSFAEYLKLVQR